MNNLNHHRPPKHRYRLPSEVSAALQQKSAEEQARLAEMWDLAENYYGDEPDDATFRALGVEIWHNLEAALHQETQEPARKPYLRLVKAPLRLITPQTMRWVGIAACIVLLVAVGLVFTNRPVSVEAPYGAQLTHTLPDGSVVTLNSGTRISYASTFGEETRQVKLTRGEVFFEVTKAEQPFSVQTFNGRVTVLGTQFNVRAWSSDVDAATEVAVASGTVRFAPHRHPEQAVILEAGQSARLAHASDAPITLDTVNTPNALSWRAGSFKFSRHAFGTVIDELERRFDVRIQVSPLSLLNEPVGILIENPLGAEEIIRDICEFNGCQYRAIPGGYEITQPAAVE